MKRWWRNAPLRRAASRLHGGVYFRQEPSPPRDGIESAAWARTQNRWLPWRGRRMEADAPYHATFEPQPFLIPHPALEEHRWPSHEARVGGTYVVEVPFGRTIGARGAVLTDENLLLSDLSITELARHELLLAPQTPPGKLRRLRGTYALLHSLGTSTYHWFYDTVPRFEVLRRAGYDLAAFDGFLLRRPKYEPHYALLERLGIPEHKIIWCTKNSHIGCDRLVVPSFTTDQDGDDQKDHHPWVFPFLRGLGPTGAPGPRRRLLINRKDSRAATRQILNQPELAALLARYGFEEVTLGELDFASQARLFASAEMIVSAHGGGLSNLCFCDPSARLLELFAADYVRAHFRNITRQIGIAYQPLVTGPQEDAGAPHLGGNIRIDLQQVQRVVETMLR